MPDVSHLLDKDEIPEFVPQKRMLESDRQRIYGGEDVAVTRTGDSYIVSVLGDMAQASSKPREQIEPDDPTENLFFRVSYSAGIATIKPGALSHMTWSEGFWIPEETPTSESSLEVEVPCYIYAVVPLELQSNTTDADDGSVPFNTLSENVTIEGNPYTIAVSMTTDYKKVDVSSITISQLDEEGIFVAKEAVDSGSDGNFHARIAYINDDGVVEQNHVGTLPVPQSFSARPNSITVT